METAWKMVAWGRLGDQKDFDLKTELDLLGSHNTQELDGCKIWWRAEGSPERKGTGRMRTQSWRCHGLWVLTDLAL